jgi:EAL domain-containing protein (putative c-di-GMP-specific phosphodiesterase class I)
VHDFKSAIDDGELLLHYQPKIEIATDRVVGVEALVRWRHPSLGLIPPAGFIPMVENTVLIGPMTSWILEAAIRQHAQWARDGLVMPVAVNLSARNLDNKLVAEVDRLLQRYAMPPEHLELEITETAIMTDPDRSVGVLRQLRGLGVRLAIDDFGTGHSSLSYLQQLPVTTIKVAGSFVSKMRSSHADLVIVRSTIDLAQSLGLEVVAEGVDDQQVWEALSALGCHLAQGHLRARPVPGEQIPDLMNLVTLHV